MKSSFLAIFGILLTMYSCDILSSKQPSNADSVVIDSLQNEIQLLKQSNDSLISELAYVAQLNQNIHLEREAAKKELSALKKKYRVGPSSSKDPLAKYNLQLSRSKTGYVYSNLDRLFLPAITLEFKNKSKLDLNERVYLKFIFVNKKTGEQIHETQKTFTDSYGPLAGGLVKQITQRSEVGWYAIKDQNVSVRVYIRDAFWKEFKIETDVYEGRI